MKAKDIVTFKTVDEFGASFGLSALDMELLRQKKCAIARLKKIREDQEITQTQLAKLVGTKQPAIARMEAGDVGGISLDFISKIAMVLGVVVTIRPPKNNTA